MIDPPNHPNAYRRGMPESTEDVMYHRHRNDAEAALTQAKMKSYDPQQAAVYLGIAEAHLALMETYRERT